MERDRALKERDKFKSYVDELIKEREELLGERKGGLPLSNRNIESFEKRIIVNQVSNKQPNIAHKEKIEETKSKKDTIKQTNLIRQSEIKSTQ